MAYTKQECLLLSCDGCEKPFEHEYIPHYASESEAREEATELDWTFTGGLAWCGYCDMPNCACGGTFIDHIEEDEGCEHCDGSCERYHAAEPEPSRSDRVS